CRGAGEGTVIPFPYWRGEGAEDRKAIFGWGTRRLPLDTCFLFPMREFLEIRSSEADYFVAFFRPSRQFVHAAAAHLGDEGLGRNPASVHTGAASGDCRTGGGNGAQQLL